MEITKASEKVGRTMTSMMRVLCAMLLCSGLSGCVMLGGSSRGGFFFIPGGIGLLVLVLLFVLLSRRR